MRRDPLSHFERAVATHGDTVRFRVGPFTMVLANRPQDIRHVLVKNHQAYKKSPSYDVLRGVIGNGLVTSEGDFWRRQRKLSQPAFHHRSLVRFAETMSELSSELAESWASVDGRPRRIEIHEEMMNITLRIVGHTLMSTEFAGETSTIGNALTTVLEYAADVDALMIVPKWLPTPGRIRANRALEVLDDVVYRLIRERRKLETQPVDLLGMLIAATDSDDDSTMTDLQLRDEIMTMVLAGHETTANALAWTFYLLGQHRDVEDKLLAEIDEVLEGRPPTLADVASLEYTEKVIKEAMRIYPPVWIVERQALERDTVGGYAVEKDWLVGVAPWVLHRDPEVFPNPERFDPERFTPEACASRDRYAYLPFGAGPRTCIGNAFAMMEAKIIVATLLSRYRIALRRGQRIAPVAGITLRPSPGIWVDAIERRK